MPYVENFRILHICQLETSEISPHVERFSISPQFSYRKAEISPHYNFFSTNKGGRRKRRGEGGKRRRRRRRRRSNVWLYTYRLRGWKRLLSTSQRPPLKKSSLEKNVIFSPRWKLLLFLIPQCKEIQISIIQVIIKNKEIAWYQNDKGSTEIILDKFWFKKILKNKTRKINDLLNNF